MTLSKSDVSRIDQQLDCAQRFLHHRRALGKARAAGNTVAQLEHSLHICDTMIGLAKSPGQTDHWRSMHRQISDLILEAGYQWRGGRLVDPGAASKAKSFGGSIGQPKEPTASANRAADYNRLRTEIIQAMAKARSERDFASRLQLITLRDELALQAASEGLTLDDKWRFVPVKA